MLTVYIIEKLVLTLDRGFAQDARMITSNERDRRRQRTGKGENMTISIITGPQSKTQGPEFTMKGPRFSDEERWLVLMLMLVKSVEP